MNNVVQNGAYVVVRKQNFAENGDVIVAIVDNEEQATLKRFKTTNDEQFVMLEPDSTYSEYSTRLINLKDTDFIILGKVIGDFRVWN